VAGLTMHQGDLDHIFQKLDNANRKLDAVLYNQDRIVAEQQAQRKLIMALKDDLAAAVAGFQSAFASLDAAVKAEIAALTAALANQQDPALAAAVTSAISGLTAASATAAADTAALSASLPPAPPAPPAPGP
jgi:hypothetical protein